MTPSEPHKPPEEAPVVITPDCYTYHEWDCLMDGTLPMDRQTHMLECRKCSGEYIRYIKADRQ